MKLRFTFNVLRGLRSEAIFDIVINDPKMADYRKLLDMELFINERTDVRLHVIEQGEVEEVRKGEKS